ncbi:MAG TPA: hypothetical protein VF787_01385 [Thermoanaerobaculia bacterium]
MTNQSEWQEANRELIAEARRKFGEPPTAEEMFAYSRGEMSEEEADRIREMLLAYPELARAYSAEFPEAPVPGDADYVPEAEVDAAWNALQSRLGANGKIVRFRNFPTAVAALLAVVFFGLFVYAEGRARHYRGLAITGPVVVREFQEFDADTPRGGAIPQTLIGVGDLYAMSLRPLTGVRYESYRIEMVRDGEEPIRINDAKLDDKDSFNIVIPRGLVRPGDYRLRIYGMDGRDDHDAGTILVRVPTP